MTLAVLLCAGGSARFAGEQSKLLTSFRGRPLVSWAFEQAGNAGLEELIVVVGGVDLSAVLGGAVTVDNPEWASGLASSLRAGIAEAARRGHDAVVVGLGDQALVPPSAWRAVAASTSPIAVGTFDGRRSPPTRLADSVWELLPRSGDVGARELMRARPDLVAEVACDGDPLDIDTVEDWERWN